MRQIERVGGCFVRCVLQKCSLWRSFYVPLFKEIRCRSVDDIVDIVMYREALHCKKSRESLCFA